jgi:hypothetical protein
MTHWVKFPWREVKISLKGLDTVGKGTIKIPPSPENWRTDPVAMIDLKILFYKCLTVFSSGYIAESMYSGGEDFWKFNTDIMGKKERSDVPMLREIAAVLPRQEFEAVLNKTYEEMKDPVKWGIVLDVAGQLLRDGVIKKIPNGLDGNYAFDEIEPEHDAKFLIKYLTNELYREKKKKAA